MDFNKIDTILKIIEEAKVIRLSELGRMLDLTQKELLPYLFEEGLLIDSWNNDVPHDDFKEVRLCQKGFIYLFKKNHFDMISAFCEILEVNNYDISLLDEFLETQDFSKIAEEILTLENFITFINIYDCALKV